MAGYDAEIAPCLAGWIERNMQEIGDLRRVRVRCCDMLPFQWLPGFMPTVRGITLWNTVYLKRQCCPIDPANLDLVELLLHELVHVVQFRRGPLIFPLQYLVAYARVGYWRIPAEVEARNRAEELLDGYRRDFPCQNYGAG